MATRGHPCTNLMPYPKPRVYWYMMQPSFTSAPRANTITASPHLYPKTFRAFQPAMRNPGPAHHGAGAALIGLEPALALVAQPVDLLTRDDDLAQNAINHDLAAVARRHPAAVAGGGLAEGGEEGRNGVERSCDAEGAKVKDQTCERKRVWERLWPAVTSGQPGAIQSRANHRH